MLLNKSLIIQSILLCLIISSLAVLAYYSKTYVTQAHNIDNLKVIYPSAEVIRVEPMQPGGKSFTAKDKKVYNNFRAKKKSKSTTKQGAFSILQN